MLKRSIIGSLVIIVTTLLVTEANAVICPTTKFQCDLNGDGIKETCRYTALGGTCLLSPASVLIQMSANQLNTNNDGGQIQAEISALPSPAPSILPGLVLCATKSGQDPWGSVEAEISGQLTLTGEAPVIVSAATTAATFEAKLDDPALRTLDQFCGGHVAVDFVPFSFTLVLSIVNPDGTVDSQGNNSIAAACVHPDPDSVGLVTQGRNKGAITGGPYECDLCPFVDLNGDRIADVSGCASCVNADGSLNESCQPLGEIAKPH